MRIKLMDRRGLHSNCSYEYSISRIKWVLSKKEIDNVVPSSNIWRRGKSCAASVASDMPEPQKDRKRIPKEARRALIESFVDKYKAVNDGKFPSASHTKKQVGGSFYVVRSILQELQSESKFPSLKSRSERSFQEMTINEISNADGKQLEAPSDWQMSSSSAEKASSSDDVKFATRVSHSILPTRRNLQEKDSEEASTSYHKAPDTNCKEDLGSSEFVYTESHMLKAEREAVSDICMESKSLSEGQKQEGPSNREDEQVHSSPELDRAKVKYRRDKDAELPSKSKPWEHIKSFVDGIMNMWRNR